FAEPVDTELIAGYLDLVAEPMDFATVQKKLDFGLYGTIAEFRADLQLIWDNCKEFNPPETVYYRAA
ncbi:Bromodomain-containing protein, partial [Catenaria anguillulae PL171]